MARVNRWARKLHRIAAYLVGLQLLLWVSGGIVFAWVPFDSLIKGGAVLRELPATPLPDGWRERLLRIDTAGEGTTALSTHESAQGLLLRIDGASGTRWLRLADGEFSRRPSPREVKAYAEKLYDGDAPAGKARHVAGTERRVLGLVDEMYGRTDVWQVAFDDRYGTRLYFDGPTGRYITVRNDFWVLYDALWRFHIMDYESGEDFNNPLLTVFASLAAVFVLSGIVLVYFAARRDWRNRPWQ